MNSQERMGIAPDTITFASIERAKTKPGTHFRDITDEMCHTYEAKNSDYGDAYEEGYKLFGPTQLLSRIHEKFCRAYNLLNGAESRVLDESIIDTLTDMANQCIILRMFIEQEKEKQKNVF